MSAILTVCYSLQMCVQLLKLDLCKTYLVQSVPLHHGLLYYILLFTLYVYISLLQYIVYYKQLS